MLGLLLFFLFTIMTCSGFQVGTTRAINKIHTSNKLMKSYNQRTSSLKMNFFDDAFRYFSQLNKEASAKHILIKVSFEIYT